MGRSKGDSRTGQEREGIKKKGEGVRKILGRGRRGKGWIEVRRREESGKGEEGGGEMDGQRERRSKGEKEVKRRKGKEKTR